MNTQTMPMTTLRASINPELIISQISYAGQPWHMKMYRNGYEPFFNQLPVLNPMDFFVMDKAKFSTQIMQDLAKVLREETWVHTPVSDNEFRRTIIAIEEPKPYQLRDEIGMPTQIKYQEGKELVVAKWGKGFSSPIHGHASGFLHEEILYGKIKVNTYRIVDEMKRIVVPVRTDIITSGTFLSKYIIPEEGDQPYSKYVHNFEALEDSATLHYLPGHTRDGRDNTYKPVFFDAEYDFYNEDMRRITSHDAMYSRKGTVILVRSTNVPEYGDHFIVITGAPVMKDHGLRPQEIAIQAPYSKEYLKGYDLNETGLILLKLSEHAAKDFLNFHGITIDNGEVVFPEA